MIATLLKQRINALSPIDIAGGAIAATMLLAFTFGVLGPIALREQRAAAQRLQVLHQQQHLRVTSASVQTLAAQVQQEQAKIAASPLHILPHSALNSRLAALVGLANECGLVVSDLKPGSGIAGSRFVAIPISISGRGGYLAVATFLHSLHDRFCDVAVRGFSLDGNSPRTGGGTFTIDLQWLAQPPGQVAAASPAE